MKITMTVLILALFMALDSGTALSAEEIKLRHALSLYAGERDDGMKQPNGLDCDDPSGVIVADSGNGRLLRYTLREGSVQSVKEIRVPDMTYPLLVKRNSKGELFVLDGRTRRILRLGPEGGFKGPLDIAGPGDPSLVIPRSFTLGPQDELYVLDGLGGRLLVLSADGAMQRQVKLPEGSGFISDLTVDRKGTVYLIDSVKAMVYAAATNVSAFSPLTRDLREHLDFPAAITVSARGLLYLTDRNGGGIVILGRDGAFLGRRLSKGWSEGLLRYPSQTCVNETGDLFVADRGNNRVQVFTVVK